MVALLVILTIVLFFTIDYFISRKKAAAEVHVSAPAFSETLTLPGGYYLSKSHTWVQLLFSGNVKVGMDEFVHNLIGSADAMEVAPANTVVRKGEPVFTLIKNGRRLSFLSPVSGKVAERNELLLNERDVLKADPYQAGWIVAMTPTNLKRELKLLRITDDAATWLKAELTRFRDFITAQPSQSKPAFATLLDGGMPVRGAMESYNQQTWESFQKEFLSE